MKKPSVKDCLNEVARLTAENERLRRLVETHRPELDALRKIEVGLRDYLNNGAQALERLHEHAKALLPGNDDLPSLRELGGYISDGRERVLQALDERDTNR